MAGGSIGGGIATVTFSSSDNLTMAANAANTILAGIQSGAFTPVFYSGSGSVISAPASVSGVAVFEAPTPQPVSVAPGDPDIVVNADGPVSIRGGATGGVLLAGAGPAGAALNLSYTDITPSGSATDTIVVTDGNNLIQTMASGAGNYNIATGSGNDTINVLAGNSTVNAATGSNQINLGTGANLVNSTGLDTITGAPTGGGADTVNVTSGTTSISGKTSSFLVNDSSPNPLHVTLGTGADTVTVSGSGTATVQGLANTMLTTANATVMGTEQGSGDFFVLAGGVSTVTAGVASDTVQALSGANMIQAGTGNDTLLAGVGADTLVGGFGGASSAALVSGSGLGTTYTFVSGQSGGADTISGFKSSDRIAFTGYGPDPQGTAITIGGSTIVTLSDGTTVTIAGATPTAGQFIVK